jgi:eukaryotic-like serine/threonine-protein kinase
MSSLQVTTSLSQGALIAEKYRLLRHLGGGAMGAVWAARNEHTSGQVALKLILGRGPELRLRLLREAQACCQIRHKNVIQIHDVGQTDSGDPFLVMELLSGETLADLLGRKRRLTQREAAVIGRDVARALGAAHDKGIVHRDLKPKNVFLHNQPGEDARVVKVLDFGVSKNLMLADGARASLDGPLGTPSYMSPEQASLDRDIDGRADIWSLGVLLFEMLTGERPFLGEGQEVIDRILRAEIPVASRRVRSIDPGLDRLISGCLTRDRDQRSWPITEVEQGLDAFVEGPPRTTTPTLTSLWGAPAGAALPPTSSARGAGAPPDSAREMDAETQKLAVETLAAFAVPERAPRARFLSERPPSVPHDATVKMFSSAPPPSSSSSPLQAALANAVLTEDLSPVPLSVRSRAEPPELPELPDPSPALRVDSTPLLGELPPPGRDRLLIARVVVACVVASVVLALALIKGGAPGSSAVAPVAPTASVEAGSISMGESAPVVEESPALPRAVVPGAHIAVTSSAAPPKIESKARPPARVAAPKPQRKCSRFIKTGCDASP